MSPLCTYDGITYRSRGVRPGSAWSGFSWPAFPVGDPYVSDEHKPYGAVDAGHVRNVGPRFDEFRVGVSGTTVDQPAEEGVEFVTGDRVRFTFQGTSTFDPSVSYWVINANASTFQVSLTEGGAAVSGGTPIPPVDFAGVAYTAEAPTVYIGNYNMVGANPSIDFLDIFGRVTVKSSVTGVPRATDCIIRGSWTHTISTSSAVDAAVWGDNSTMRGLQMSWCRIDLTGRETPFTEGFRGGNGTFDYGEIYRATDGASFNYGVGTGGSTKRRSRSAWGCFFAWHNDSSPGTNCPVLPSLVARGVTAWPSFSDKRTHSDGTQIHQGGPWVVEGNNFGGARAASAPPAANLDPYVPADAAIIADVHNALDYANCGMVIVNTSAPSTFPIIALITKNWGWGGPSGINLGPVAPDNMAGVTVTRNKVHTTVPANFPVISNSSSATFADNIDEFGNPLTPLF